MNHPATDVHPLRGCELCSQHRRVAGQLMCAEPEVAGALGLVPCEHARYGSFGQPGGCGRDAHRLQWLAIELAAHSQERFAA